MSEQTTNETTDNASPQSEETNGQSYSNAEPQAPVPVDAASAQASAVPEQAQTGARAPQFPQQPAPVAQPQASNTVQAAQPQASAQQPAQAPQYASQPQQPAQGMQSGPQQPSAQSAPTAPQQLQAAPAQSPVAAQGQTQPAPQTSQAPQQTATAAKPQTYQPQQNGNAQVPGANSANQNNWEYQALQHGWVPPTQDGHQGAQQPGPAPRQQWQQQQQSPQPPAGWQQNQQQNGWGQTPQQWQQPNGQNPQQPAPQGSKPQPPEAFNGSMKALWVVAGALAGIFSLLLVLLFGMGRSPQYRAQAIRWACVGIIIGVFVDLAVFSFAGVSPNTMAGGSGLSSGTTPAPSSGGSAF